MKAQKLASLELMSEHLDGSPSARHLPTRPLVVHHPLNRKLFEASHPLNANTCFLLSSYPADTIFSDCANSSCQTAPCSTVPSASGQGAAWLVVAVGDPAPLPQPLPQFPSHQRPALCRPPAPLSSSRGPQMCHKLIC